MPYSSCPIRCALLLAALASAASAAEPIEVFHDDGIVIVDSEDGRFQWRLDGRVQVDAAHYQEGENPLADGAELRRVRLAIKTILWKDWAAELDVEFEEDEIEVKDAWLAYIGLPSTIIRLGNQKEPFSLEELTSSRNVTFLERALPNVFAPARHIGVSYTRWGARWHASAGIFGEEATDVDETGEDDGVGASGRFVFTPIRDDNRIVHLGLSATTRTPDAGSDDRIRLRVRPETHVNRARFVNTGRIRNVDRYRALGFEAAAQIGAFHLQGEYISADVERMAGATDASFDGWYAYISWSPTGDRQPYTLDAAEFGRMVPLEKRGAWELALRFSSVDLNDLAAGIEGGSSDIATFGVNYYANANIRLMLNLSQVENDEFADADGDLVGGDEFEVAQMRIQITF